MTKHEGVYFLCERRLLSLQWGLDAPLALRPHGHVHWVQDYGDRRRLYELIPLQGLIKYGNMSNPYILPGMVFVWMILAYTKWHKNEHFLFNINQWLCSSNRIFLNQKARRKEKGSSHDVMSAWFPLCIQSKWAPCLLPRKTSLVEYCRSHIFLGFLTLSIGQGVQMIKTDKLDNYHSKWKERAAIFF